MPPEANSLSPIAIRLLEEGRALLAADDADQAVKALRQAQIEAPNSPKILHPLAQALHVTGQMLPALQTYDRLIELGAADAAIWCETGNALTDVSEYSQAIGAYQQSLSLQEDAAEAHHNLGRVLYRLGEVTQAVEHIERSVALSGSLTAWSSLATMIPGDPQADPAKIRRLREQYAARLAPLAPARSTRKRPRTAQRIRLGYLSAYFHTPNYMKPVWGLINHHDREQFDIDLFSDSPSHALDGYLEHASDHVHHIRDKDNQAASELIASREIDILIDLNAYSHVERLPLFVHKPAPITAAWFNMYATSGFAGFDYLIGDQHVIKDGEEAFFTERLLRLPLSYLTFNVLHPTPEVAPAPCEREHALTFGSLVSQYKITPPVVDTWSAILKRVPEARLLLANSALRSPHNRRFVTDRFAERGIASDRLTLLGPANHLDFLRYYDRIDIALDAFPYNGGTTTMEALWQGVPVVALDGDRWASRTSATLLKESHVPEFVAGNPEEYVRIAVQWANLAETLPRLTSLRREMRDKLAASSACDVKRLAASMESLYQRLPVGRD